MFAMACKTTTGGLFIFIFLLLLRKMRTDAFKVTSVPVFPTPPSCMCLSP